MPARPSSAAVRKIAWERDHGRCCDCGEVASSWDAEHEIPIWQGGAALDPANIKTRCRGACHKEKTRREATQRAKEARCRQKFGHLRQLQKGKPACSPSRKLPF
ncbi:MAG: hypothetical protein KGL26_01065 [Pseudomonadota bacterium]|nr:hypothetical protein [Pseudomonadota bacterium]